MIVYVAVSEKYQRIDIVVLTFFARLERRAKWNPISCGDMFSFIGISSVELPVWKSLQ